MKLRRKMLYVPGNTGMVKDAARFLVFNALKTLFYRDIEKVFRVNGLDMPHGLADVDAMMAVGVDTIRLPKTETAGEIVQIEAVIAAVESVKGILNAREITLASPCLVGIAICAEDFMTGMHTIRSLEGTELLVARSMLVMAARHRGHGIGYGRQADRGAGAAEPGSGQDLGDRDR